EAFSMVEPGYQSGKRQTGRTPPEKAWATARGRELTGWERVSQCAGERGARGPRRGSPRASEPPRSIRTFPLRGPYEAVRDRGKGPENQFLWPLPFRGSPRTCRRC